MRSTAVQYVGIDVHQATLVCGVKHETGQTTIKSKVATRREAIESFIRGLGGRVRIAFEEGSQAQWLYELLRPISERLIVCDPRKIATKGTKTIDGTRSDSASCFDSMRYRLSFTTTGIESSKSWFNATKDWWRIRCG